MPDQTTDNPQPPRQFLEGPIAEAHLASSARLDDFGKLGHVPTLHGDCESSSSGYEE